jgi:hypothetical protein
VVNATVIMHMAQEVHAALLGVLAAQSPWAGMYDEKAVVQDQGDDKGTARREWECKAQVSDVSSMVIVAFKKATFGADFSFESTDNAVRRKQLLRTFPLLLCVHRIEVLVATGESFVQLFDVVVERSDLQGVLGLVEETTGERGVNLSG